MIKNIGGIGCWANAVEALRFDVIGSTKTQTYRVSQLHNGLYYGFEIYHKKTWLKLTAIDTDTLCRDGWSPIPALFIQFKNDAWSIWRKLPGNIYASRRVPD